MPDRHGRCPPPGASTKVVSHRIAIGKVERARPLPAPSHTAQEPCSAREVKQHSRPDQLRRRMHVIRLLIKIEPAPLGLRCRSASSHSHPQSTEKPPSFLLPVIQLVGGDRRRLRSDPRARLHLCRDLLRRRTTLPMACIAMSSSAQQPVSSWVDSSLPLLRHRQRNVWLTV